MNRVLPMQFEMAILAFSPPERVLSNSSLVQFSLDSQMLQPLLFIFLVLDVPWPMAPLPHPLKCDSSPNFLESGPSKNGQMAKPDPSRC